MPEFPIATPCECPAHGKDYPVYTKGGLRIIDTCAIKEKQSMRGLSVMVSGHFDPFHDGHLSYLKQAIHQGDFLYCIVSNDWQLMMKKGKVNIPAKGRAEIVDLILSGLGAHHWVSINRYDIQTTLVAEALRIVKPDIFFRGGDKTLETMPPEERQVCEELHIEIRHAVLEKDTHGAGMLL